MCATAMDASWTWSSTPADFSATNDRILSTMLEVFATTYSASVQDTTYKMACSILAAVPGVDGVRYELPNKHYFEISE